MKKTMKGKDKMGIKFKKSIIFCLVIILCATSTGLRNQVRAYTPPVVTNADISYPISLSTGKDTKGKLIFTDKEFLAYVSKEVFGSGEYYGFEFDLNEDGMLSKAECELVRIINVAGKKEITSLSGIEAFPKLRELYCNDTGISSLDLQNNPRLKTLSCAETKIRELDLSGCPILEELKISGCSLGAIDLSKNTALTYLVCGSQYIDTYEYQENGRYCVALEDMGKTLDLSKVSDVKIDGADGDNIGSGYDAEKGIAWCSDEMNSISYQYHLQLKSKTEAMDDVINVTVNLKSGIRESFDSRGGSRVVSELMERGAKDAEPQPPEKAGCEFTGWYVTPECRETDRWTFGQVLNQNITLYAGWKNKVYQAVYQSDGKRVSVKNVDWWTKNLLNGVTVSKAGYILKGWNTESGIILNSANQAALTYGQISGSDKKQETVLSAIWEARTGYRLKLSTNVSAKLKRKMDSEIRFRSGKNNSFVWGQSRILSKIWTGRIPGYTMIGWYTAKKGGKKITKETTYGEIYSSNLSGDSIEKVPTIYARYKKTRYTVRYNTKGGSHIKNKTNVKWGSKVPIPKKKPKKKGYIFKGWKIEGKRVKKGARLNNEYTFYCWEKKVTLSAVWKKKKR